MKASVVEKREPDPLTKKPIPHAYALIEDPNKPGMYFPVHLSNVYAENIEKLGLNPTSSYREMGLNRIVADLRQRHRKTGGWDK